MPSDRIPKASAIAATKTETPPVVEPRSSTATMAVKDLPGDAAVIEKGKVKSHDARRRSGKEKAGYRDQFRIRRAPRPDPMAELQRTIWAPPVNEAELVARQLLAQQVGGLRPSRYNWLVFGRRPRSPHRPQLKA